MASISFDSQSFLLDGRRVWLVGGAIHYPRVPRGLWRDRIRAARQAGLNCVETYVFWNVHEPRPGVFDFQGQNDLRAFVQTVREEGMLCILRPGPYVCAEWDFGGLPAWLHRIPNLKLREANGPFLEACARYLGAVMEQVRDLQVTSPAAADAPKLSASGLPAIAGGGPIVMIQAENEWFCHHPQQGETYLREIVRYLRENGCEVPINNCNNLWQRIDGTIDTWNANAHLAPDLRQLRVVQPDAPRIVTEYWPGWFDQWGRPHHTAFDADLNTYRLAQVLAAGAQPSLYMFHGGTNFGFFGGRTVASPDCFMTTSYDYDAPLKEAGGRGKKYLAVKRIGTFASQFAGVFAALESDYQPAVVAPDEKPHPVSVIHQHGSAGDVVWLLRDSVGDAASKEVRLLLPDGQSLPVPMGEDRAAWLLLNANLGGVAELTHTNLRPWAFTHRRLLVLFGPAGAHGLVSINHAPLSLSVPEGRRPVVQAFEGLSVAVLNREQVDAAYLTHDGLVVGAAGLDADDRPVPMNGWAETYHIAPDGKIAATRARPVRPPTPPALTAWQRHVPRSLLDGSDPAYQPIDGPAALEILRCDYGYGWYRLNTPTPASASAVLAPRAGDRLHLHQHGKPVRILGLGPGAEHEPVPLRLDHATVVLADNLGRFNYGWHLGEPKGLFGHLYAVAPVRLGRPRVLADRSPDAFALRGYWQQLRHGESRPADHLVWSFNYTPGAQRLPMILDLRDLRARAMVMVNHKPLAMYDHNLSARYLRLLIEPTDLLRKGKNELRLALYGPSSKEWDLDQQVRLYRVTSNLTARSQWAFTPWTLPASEAYSDGSTAAPGGTCAFYRGRFSVRHTDRPLFVELKGLTKGQLYLNGQNVGRYFVADPSTGKPLPPQQRYYLPEPWLRTDAPNELVIFEEHGKSPSRCKLVYDAMGPYGE